MILQRPPQLADVVAWKPHKWVDGEYGLVVGEQVYSLHGDRSFTLRSFVVLSDEREAEGGKLTLRPALYASNAYYVEEWKTRVLDPSEYVILRDGRPVKPAIIAGSVVLEWEKEKSS